MILVFKKRRIKIEEFEFREKIDIKIGNTLLELRNKGDKLDDGLVLVDLLLKL